VVSNFNTADLGTQVTQVPLSSETSETCWYLRTLLDAYFAGTSIQDAQERYVLQVLRVNMISSGCNGKDGQGLKGMEADGTGQARSEYSHYSLLHFS
jgi:hypothetical protein